MGVPMTFDDADVRVIEEAAPAFAPGDRVRLRLPGAPLMLVENADDTEALCVWVDDNAVVHRAGLAVAVIEKVTD